MPRYSKFRLMAHPPMYFVETAYLAPPESRCAEEISNLSLIPCILPRLLFSCYCEKNIFPARGDRSARICPGIRLPAGLSSQAEVEEFQAVHPVVALVNHRAGVLQPCPGIEGRASGIKMLAIIDLHHKMLRHGEQTQGGVQVRRLRRCLPDEALAPFADAWRRSRCPPRGSRAPSACPGRPRSSTGTASWSPVSINTGTP